LEWNQNAKLYWLSSVDNPKIKSSISGIDGKRRFWNFEFVNVETNENLIVTIHDEQVVNSIESRTAVIKNKIINMEEVTVDSVDVLKKAKEYFNLQPGENWAEGYHFELNRKNNTTFLTVVGLDTNGYFSRIYFNAIDGKLIYGTHKMPTGGGLSICDNKKPIFFDRNISIEGISSSLNYENDNTIIFWGYLNSRPDFLPIVKISENNGQTWKDLTINNVKTIMKLWFSDFDNNTIYACTENKIIKSLDKGNKWVDVLKTNHPIVDISTSNNCIAVLTDENLHISFNKGQTWKLANIPFDEGYIKVNCDGELFMFNNEKNFKKVSNDWINMKTPFEDDLRGIEIVEDTLIAYTSKNIGFLNLTNNKWKLYDSKQKIEKIFSIANSEYNHQLFLLTNSGDLLNIKIKSGGVIDKQFHS
jgi:hypothetical protein